MEVNPVNGIIKSRKLCYYNDKFSDEDLCLTKDYEDNVKKLKSYLKIDEDGKSKFDYVTCSTLDDGTFECVDTDPAYITKYGRDKLGHYYDTEMRFAFYKTGPIYILRDYTQEDHRGYTPNYLGMTTFDQSSLNSDGKFGNNSY